MKVALVTEWLDAWRGGAETSTLQFMHHLMAKGIEVHVFTRSRPSPAPGLSVHTVSGASMSRTRQSITFARRVERHVANGRFDIVHAITPCRGADVYQPRGGTVAETIERNLALIRTTSGQSLKRCANRFNFKQRYQLRLEREILGGADGPIVVAISDYVVRQLEGHYALPEERIRKVYNGVDPDDATEETRAKNRAAIRTEFGVREDQCLVLLIAHNFRLKGVGRWMEALALLRKRGVDDVRSLVIGKGDSVRWHTRAARLGVDDLLAFTGPTDRVAAFRHAAEALVHPTYYDPCSRVVLEAMSAGLPCITTRWDGASEMVRDGKSGYVIDDVCDTATLADRIQDLRDPDRRRVVGRAAKSAVAEVSMARHCAEMTALYDAIAGTPSL